MQTTEPPPSTGGVTAQARQFFAACAQYAAARLRLASMEGKEAGAHVMKMLLLGAAAVFVAVFGWLFVCLALVFVIAKIFGGGDAWLWASLAMAAGHFIAAIILGFAVKAKLGTTLFPLTTEEFKKDQQWLETPTKQD